VISDFLESYPYGPFEVLVIETIANSLDSDASKVRIRIEDRPEGLSYEIEDDGRGMTRNQFENNYHALALSSKTKGQGIGFAGIGAKLYLACLSSGQSIITETRHKGQTLASELTLIKGEPKWRYLSKSLAHDGTTYRVVLDPSSALVSNETVEEIVRKHFNSMLFRGETTVFVGEKELAAWVPSNGKPMTSSFRIKESEYQCRFWLANAELERSGVEVSVFGKRIIAGDYFGTDYQIKPNFRKRVYGMVDADGLAVLLNTPKTDFRTSVNSQLWSTFRKQIYSHLKRWLEEIGALQAERKPSVQAELAALQLEITSVLDNIFKNPSLMKYNPFLRQRLARTTIPSSSGQVKASLAEGIQETLGDQRGETPGHGVNTPGSEPGSALRQEDEGREKASEVERKVRSGIKLNYAEEPENERQSWYTPEAIVINVGHPTFVKSDAQGFYSEEQHVLRCVFLTLLEAFPPQTVNEAVEDINRFYSVWGKMP